MLDSFVRITYIYIFFRLRRVRFNNVYFFLLYILYREYIELWIFILRIVIVLDNKKNQQYKDISVLEV